MAEELNGIRFSSEAGYGPSHGTQVVDPGRGRRGIFMLLLDITIVNVALPTSSATFDASLSDLQWVIDAYALTLAACPLTAGSLADRFGRRRLFVIGIVVFTLGSLLCGLAPRAVPVLARAGQGVGGAIMFATSLALLSTPSRQGPGRGLRRVRRDHRHRRRGGPAAGRPADHRAVVALDLLGERADRHLRPGVRCAGRGVARPARVRPDWLGFVTFSAGLGAAGLRR